MLFETKASNAKHLSLRSNSVFQRSLATQKQKFAKVRSMPVAPKDCLSYRWLQTEQIKAEGEVAAGVCFGLSVKWAGRHRLSKDNEEAKDRVVAITKDVVALMELQKAYQAAGGAPKDKEASFWSGAGFTIGDYSSKQVTPDNAKSASDAIADMLVQASKARAYTSLGWRGANGGHQMVCYHSSGKVLGL